MVNVSPGFVLWGDGRPQLERAAGLLAAATRIQRLIAAEELEPDREGGAPRCMREYARLFASTRIPGATRDLLAQYPGSRHVVVVHRGRFSALDVVDPGGRPYDRRELERVLDQIADEPAPEEPSFGVLTADGRRRGRASISLARGERAAQRSE